MRRSKNGVKGSWPPGQGIGEEESVHSTSSSNLPPSRRDTADTVDDVL